MLPRSRRRVRHKGSTDIDLTPYMNLLVVLAPFLLVTAVFERLSALEIYLPQPVAAEAVTGAKPPALPENQLLLTISISDKGILVANGAQLLTLVQPTPTGYDLPALSATLQQLKAHYPTADSAAILCKGNVAYETLVAVMDTAREALVTVDGQKKRYVLFPNISLGEVL
jgi:biopolymer transport protein ExbD